MLHAESTWETMACRVLAQHNLPDSGSSGSEVMPRQAGGAKHIMSTAVDEVMP